MLFKTKIGTLNCPLYCSSIEPLLRLQLVSLPFTYCMVGSRDCQLRQHSTPPVDREPFSVDDYKPLTVDRMSEACSQPTSRLPRLRNDRRVSMIIMQGQLPLRLVIGSLCTCQDPERARHTSCCAHTVDPIAWSLHWTAELMFALWTNLMLSQFEWH